MRLKVKRSGRVSRARPGRVDGQPIEKKDSDHAAIRGKSMRGLGRYVRVLKLFDEKRSQWTIAEIAATLDVPSSTVYRTVQDMVAANFLESANEAQYRLGASFIEMDRMIRVTDPLHELGTPLLRDIRQQARVPCVTVIARLYNDTVMCVAQDGEDADSSIHTSYERGRPRPLARGATSKVILAQLPSRRLDRLLGKGSKADELRAELARIKKQEICVTRGEVDRGLVGIAAPILVPERALIGSFSIILREADVDPQQERRLSLLVPSAAQLLSRQLSAV